MTTDQAIAVLKNLGFTVEEPGNFNTYEVMAPDGSRTWFSLSDRELIMFAEGVKWASV